MSSTSCVNIVLEAVAVRIASMKARFLAIFAQVLYMSAGAFFLYLPSWVEHTPMPLPTIVPLTR